MNNKRVYEIKDILDHASKALKPAMYFFIGSNNDNEIAVESEPYLQAHLCEKYGVTFGFYEKGFPPEDIAATPLLCIERYPFRDEIEKTSIRFQKNLLFFLRSKRDAGWLT